MYFSLENVHRVSMKPGADPGINLTIAQIDMATFGRGICTAEAGNGGIRGRIPNFRESTLIK